MIAKLRSLARHLRGRAAFEDAMDDEMRFHLERRAEDLIRRGLSPAEAARRARLEFGSIEKQKDIARANVGLRLLDEIRGDLRYALRTFWRNKGFTAAAVVTLALGIGANTAIFSLIDALLLRSLPVSDPDELLQLTKVAAGPPGLPDETFSYPMVRALDEYQDVFAGVGGFSGATFIVGSGESMQRVRGSYVSGAFYETLGLTPVAGRLLARTDDAPGAPAVAVASYAYWQRQFAGSHAAMDQ